jgi:hypothetical protein
MGNRAALLSATAPILDSTEGIADKCHGRRMVRGQTLKNAAIWLHGSVFRRSSTSQKHQPDIS